MRNQYGGICYRCGKWCAPGEGHFERVTRDQAKKWPGFSSRTKWLTQHASCAITWRGSDHHFQYSPGQKPSDQLARELGASHG